ncbi:MAG: hypothetical protein IAF94_10035 [Pirellulaceae bacterium]|nr:hypothetical protein [Pirellulaceae bacterium]
MGFRPRLLDAAASRLRTRKRVGLVLGIAILLTAASPALAQKTLRWKLAAGDQLQVNVIQQTTSTVTIASKPVKTTMDMTLETLWSVDSADDKQIKITQTVKRLAVKLQTGDSTPIAYDSALKTPPVAAAKEVAAAVKPLLTEGSALMVTMNTRGEVLSAQANEKLAELWKTPGAKEIGGPGGSESTQELLKRSIVLLPEKRVDAGDAGKSKWTKEREVEIPIGKVKQATEFVFAGEVEEAGQKLDRIDFTSKLTLVPGGAKSLKLTLKTQEQTGHALFSAEQGRVVSAEQTQKLVTEAPYRETNITVTVESTVRTVVSPLKK